MLEKGAAKKLIIYVNEGHHYRGEPVHEAIIRFLYRHGCAGATVTKGIAGYGASGRMHEAHLFSLTEDAPMRIEVVESERKINALLPWVYKMVEDGLIEVQDTEVIKHTTHRKKTEEDRAMTREKLEGHAKMVRIYVSEDDRWEGEPLYEAIVKRLRMMDIAGATVYRGVMGYGARHRVHKSGWLGLSRDSPLMLTVVDTEENIRRVLPILDEMVEEGLIVLSDVEIIKYTHSHSKENPTGGDDAERNDRASR